MFKDFLHFKSTYVSTAYMPFVDLGCYAFGITGVLYLVEFPFLLWYTCTKVMGVDRRCLNKTHAVHVEHDEVSWVCRNGALRAGGILVPCICLQYPSRISHCFLFCSGWLYLNIFVLLTVSTALLLLPCLTPCKRCPQQSVPIIFLIVIASICGGFTSLLAN